MTDEDGFGFWEGQCQACEMWGPVNDLMLCEECDGKVQRDLIRARAWDYTAAAFGLDDEAATAGRELLRAKVIRQYGTRNERISDERPPRKPRRRRRAKG